MAAAPSARKTCASAARTTGASGATAVTKLSLIVHPRYHHTLPLLKPTATFDSLPPCVLHKIASFVTEPQDLLTLERACTRLRHAASDDEFWHKLLLDRFGWQPRQAPPSWRELYRYQHELFVSVVLKQAADTLLNMSLNRMGPGVPLGFAINVM